jgi:hypothetical protein
MDEKTQYKDIDDPKWKPTPYAPDWSQEPDG